MRRSMILGALLLVAASAHMARAVSIAHLTWVTEANFSGQICVLATHQNQAFDVFGTSLNLGSAGDILCTGSCVVPACTGHCEATSGPGTFGFDVSVPFDGSSVPAGTPFSFVGSMTNVSGSAVAALNGALTYTIDGVQTQRSMVAPSSSIPGCPIAGPVGVFDGAGGYSAFQSVAAGTGANVPVSTTASFTDPTTGAQRTSPVNLSFDNVSTGGTVTVTATSNAAGILAANFAVEVGGYRAVFLDITTTAVFSGSVEVCGGYDDVDNDGYVDGTGVPETALRLLHGEGNPLTFVDRTSSQDTEANTICALVTSLSPFVMGVDVATVSSHDGVILPVAPVKVTIPKDKPQASKTVSVKVQNADLAETAGHTAKLSITGSTCPASVLRDAAMQPVVPDFDPRSSSVGDSITIGGGKMKTAKIALTLKRDDFTTPSIKSPARCAITVATTTTAAGTVIDPNGSNNSTVIEVDVIDKNDF